MGNQYSSANQQPFLEAMRTFTNEHVDIEDHSVWKHVFTFPAEDVADGAKNILYGIFTPDAVRDLRKHHPENLAALIYKCVEQLQHFVAAKTQLRDTQSALNALGILTRIMPFVLEKRMPAPYTVPSHLQQPPPTTRPPPAVGANKKSAQADPKTVPPPPSAADVALRQVSPYTEDFAQHVLWDNNMCLPSGGGDNANKRLFPLDAPLGELLVQTVVAACFVPGFSISLKQTLGFDPQSNHPNVQPGVLWCAGIASRHAGIIDWNKEIVRHRLLLVNCLISILTGQVYQRNPSAPDPLLSVLVDVRKCPYNYTLFASLINHTLSYRINGTLPYTSHLIGPSERLVYKSTELLLICLDASPFYTQGGAAAATTTASRREEEEDEQEGARQPSSGGELTFARTSNEPMGTPDEEQSEAKNAAKSDSPTASKEKGKKKPSDHEDKKPSPGNKVPVGHAAWMLFHDCNANDYQHVMLGLLRLVGNSAYSKSTYMPGSQRRLQHNELFFALLWKLCDRVPGFLRSFCCSQHVIMFIVPILDFAMMAKDHEVHFDNLQLAIFMLWRFSCEREFCINANEANNQYVPFQAVPQHTGTYSDLIYLSMYTLLLSKHPWVQRVHESCITIMCNMSPFTTSLCSTAASMLVSLFEQSCRPNFLTANEANPHILCYVVETIANLLQYQYPGSYHVLYSLLRAQKSARALHAALLDKKAPIPEDVANNLHLFTLICAIDAVEPLVNAMASRNPNFDFRLYLKEKTTLVGTLPVPHHIIIRRFISRLQGDLWLSSWMWGLIYVESQPKFLDPRSVELFQMRTVEVQNDE